MLERSSVAQWRRERVKEKKKPEPGIWHSLLLGSPRTLSGPAEFHPNPAWAEWPAAESCQPGWLSVDPSVCGSAPLQLPSDGSPLVSEHPAVVLRAVGVAFILTLLH